MPSLKVVQTEYELQACLALRKAVFVDEQHVPLELEVDELDEPGASIHIIAQNAENSTAFATARIKKYAPGIAKIQRVAVDQSRRNTGMGRQLMAFIEATCVEQGYEKAVLDAQLTAEGFYQKLGYRRTSDKVFLDAGIEHVHMEKRLT